MKLQYSSASQAGFFIVLALLTSTGSVANAAQWKWRDAAGNITISDRSPPADIPDKNILQRPKALRSARVFSAADAASPPSSPLSAASSAAKASDPELEARRQKEQEAQEAAKKAAEALQAKAKAENCTRARGYQRTLKDGIRIARTNDKGEHEILDDASRAKEQARNDEVIKNDCKP